MPNYKESQNDYYSFDVNNVHVVSINSNIFNSHWTKPLNDSYGIQTIDWLKKDSAASKSQKFRILFLHSPFYCSKPSPKGDLRCSGWADWFREKYEQYVNGNFDVVVQAHVHTYERTLPVFKAIANMTGVSKDNSTYSEPSNPTYIVCGSPGNTEGVGSSCKIF